MELMWLTGRLAPDFKTIANFRKDNGKAIRNVCRHATSSRTCVYPMAGASTTSRCYSAIATLA